MEMEMEMQGHLLLQGGYCRALSTQLPQDHFIVEELLDFSDEKEDDAGLVADGPSDGGRGNCSAYSPTVTATDSCSNSYSGASLSLISHELMFRSLAIADADLCEPYEDLAELEWLSNFVEESFSSEELQKQQLLSGIKTTSSQPTPPPNHSFTREAAAAADDSQQFTAEAALPGKARSKRARATPSTSTWSSHLVLAPTTESSSSENSDAANQTKPIKRPSKRKEMSLAALSPSLDGRRCLHCATDKTPQWRAGPMGPKTLCNACGVRYKSGRLMPEYRPAASPTFVTSKHSNSHRKVIELRRQKGIHQQQSLPVYDTATASAPVAAGDHFLIQQRLCAEFRPVF